MKIKEDMGDSMPKKIELKILPMYFDQVYNGIQSFDIRKKDRNYEVGDTLILNEWVSNNEMINGGFYTSRKAVRQITCIITGEEFEGVAPGYCILGLR